ncbi:hypothetical protein [Treponema endosymbiont of Eucomonympha sp.]|uniref:hypothetical protein n=1 Tax=Treponema endosymbiont of Eucomonympha sp. TaxID=1580831 RepID=UPI000A7F63A7|nr:hypothetical protein [Treponema endosymbiont of Eucomonympha sp.]
MNCDVCGQEVDENKGVDGVYWGNCYTCGDNLCAGCAVKRGGWNDEGECMECDRKYGGS